MFGFLIKTSIFIAILSNLDEITINKILTGLVTVFTYGAYIANQLIKYLNG